MRPLLATLTAFFLLTTPAAASWTWPVSGEVITPYRNGTDPYASGQHRGIDIAAPIGAPAVAAAGGEVRFAGTAGSSGLTVSIRTGEGYDISYLHLSSVAVRVGGRVDAGDKIGAVGTTGTRSAPQPHLHFGVRDAGSRYAYHDPLSFLPPPPARPRAPAPPPAATAPDPAPAPPAPAPAPALVPQASPRPAPLRTPVARRSPRPAPAGTREPRPVTMPRHVAVPHTAPHPDTQASGGSRPAPDHRRSPKPAAATWAAPHAARGTDPRATPASAASSAGEIEGPRHSPRGTGDQSSPGAAGPNLGWALACAGLLLAAGVLGLTEGGRRRRERRGVRRPRVASMVHAVLRHHAHLLRQR
jgi:hypothetical protein